MRFRFSLICGLLALFFLPSCAETELASHLYKSWDAPPPNEGTFKVGKPYKADGKWYRPEETYSYTETGIASWYGPGFHNKRTANGEIFNKNELTAAHRTLQMPSLVRVTNLDNGRSLIVRINDRGPFARGRVIDVSQRAAELLGFKNIGTAKVRLDLLADESKSLAMAARQGQDTQGMEVAVNERGFDSSAPLTGQPGMQQPMGQQVASYQPISYEPIQTEPLIPGHVANGNFMPDPVVTQLPVHPTGIYVQAGSFTNAANAENLAASLRSFGNAQLRPVQIGAQQFFRVRVGPVANVPEADALLARLAASGHKQAIIVVD